MSLYEDLGGADAIDAVVDAFYVKVLADDRVKSFFDKTNMKLQAKHQKDFLTMAFGGPNNYVGRDMKAAHARLVEEEGLNDSHFDAIVELIGSTLKDFNVPAEKISEVAAIAESVREPVLGR